MEQNSQLSKVQSYFDRNSATWRDLYVNSRTTNEFVLQERSDYALDLLSKNVPLGATVLDVGCGSGLAAVKIALMGYLAHGVDISPQMIALCHERSSRTLSRIGIDLFHRRRFHGNGI